MRVLILSTMYPNSKVYLSGVFVHEQVKELLKLGLNITVIAPIPYVPLFFQYLSKKWRKFKKVPTFEKIENVNVYHPRYLAIPKGYYKNLWAYLLSFNILKVIKESGQFDLIHAHGSLPDDHAAYLVSKKLNIPYVVSIHGDTVYALTKYPSRFKSSKEALLNAKAIITVSSQVSKRVEKYINNREKIFTILNGFNVNSDLQNSKFSTDEITILFVATLIERKGCEFLIRAFSKMHGKYRNVRLIIGGGGVLLEKMTKLSNTLGISDRVVFTGTISHEKVIKLITQCDIFVLPSWDEAFGVVYLEAMAFKKPIVATEREGITDVVQDGIEGFLVKPRDVNSIIDKLTRLIEDEQLRGEIGVRGYEKIRNLTWQNNAVKTIEVYKKCILNNRT